MGREKMAEGKQEKRREEKKGRRKEEKEGEGEGICKYEHYSPQDLAGLFSELGAAPPTARLQGLFHKLNCS